MERQEERDPRTEQRRAPSRPGEPSVRVDRERSLGGLFRELATETRQLVRQEIRLARVELREIATRAGQGTGLVGAGGLVAYAGFLALVAAAGFLLSLILPIWLSFAIVGVVVLLVGYLLYRSGRKELRETDFSLARTTETLQEDRQWIREEAQDVKSDPSHLGTRR